MYAIRSYYEFPDGVAEALPTALETCTRPLFRTQGFAAIGNDAGQPGHLRRMHEYLFRVRLPIGGDVQATPEPQSLSQLIKEHLPQQPALVVALFWSYNFV